MEDEKRGDELKLLENLFGNLTTGKCIFRNYFQ